MGAAGKLKRRRDHGEGDEATAASPGAAGSSPVGSKVVAKAAAENDSAAEPASASTADTAERAAKRPRVEENRTLFVRSLPASVTDESLVAFFSEHFPVKHATIVKDRATKASRGYGFVTFTDAEDAIEAKRKLHNQKFDGSKINLEVAETRKRKPAAESAADAISQKEQRRAALEEAKKPQNSKLIIRNLPWSIKTSEQLAALFQHHGKIKFADLPQNKGKLSGFGFVTFRRRRHAELALEADNAKVVDGRTIVVDWAADKKEWTKQQKPEASEKAEKADDKADGDESEEQEEDKEDEADEEEDEDMRNFMKNHMENLEDEDGEDNDEEDDGEGEDDDEDDEDDDNNSKTPSKPLMTSNDTTLFIRNLPYSVTDEELKAHFEQFGRIRYARVVVDRATDRPAGVGFVCFVSGEESKACLRNAPRPRQSETTGKRSVLQDEMADAAGMYTLEGRVLQVSQAVNKDEATRLAATGAAAREGKNQDKRRLYLLSEGTISNGSPLHSLLSEAEIKMRDESLAQRKKMIQTNPSLHLSLTRLAIRNIPRNVDSKELKVLAREAVVGFAKDVKEGRREPLSREEITRGGAEDREAERQRREKGKGVVKQTKIVFENKQGSKVAEVDGAGKSRGYGFIEYHSHRAALMGLRWLNGHAVKSDTGKTHRLIVEFAIENAQVVARRQDLQTKFHHKGSEQAAKPTTGRAPFASRDDKAPFKKGKPPGPKGDAKGDAKGARGAKGAKADEKDDGDESKSATRKALDQKIIGRKRTMRKKKATARRG